MNKRSLSIITAIAVIALPIIGWAAYTGPTGNPTTGNPPGPVWLSPSSAQTGDINVSGFIQSYGDVISTGGDIISSNGDLITSAGDVYIPNGKAIRVDQASAQTALNIGNWGSSSQGVAVSVLGNLSVNGYGPTAGRGRINTYQICLDNGSDCRTTWPSGSVSDIWVNTTGDTMTGTLTISAAASANGGDFTGGTNGLYGKGSTAGVRGDNMGGTGYGGQFYGGDYGVYGNGSSYGVYGGGVYGVYGSGSSYGVYGGGVYGVYGSGSSYGVYGSGSSYGGYFADSNGTSHGYVGYGYYSFNGSGNFKNLGAAEFTSILTVGGNLFANAGLVTTVIDASGDITSDGDITAATIHAGTVTASGSLNGASVVTTGNITANSNSWGTQTTQACPDVTTTGPCQCPSGTFMTGVVRRTTSPYHVTSIYCNEL